MKLSNIIFTFGLIGVEATRGDDAERGSPKKNFGNDLANPKTWEGVFDGKGPKIAAKIGRSWRKLEALLLTKYRFCENIEGTPTFERIDFIHHIYVTIIMAIVMKSLSKTRPGLSTR